ncbi:MAG: DUF2442 domain-containing protein [Thermoguttaceae bacterium]|jgi:hypothetical protein
MHYVTEAYYAGGSKLRVVFENHEVRLIDLAPHLDGPVFEPLRDANYFRQFQVNHEIETVVWPNGADFSPDFLYEIGEVHEAANPPCSPSPAAPA